MHCLHAAHGPVLEPDEYIDALRIRLGLPFAAKNSECPCCGGVLDRRGIHAQSCAQAERLDKTKQERSYTTGGSLSELAELSKTKRFQRISKIQKKFCLVLIF